MCVVAQLFQDKGEGRRLRVHRCLSFSILQDVSHPFGFAWNYQWLDDVFTDFVVLGAWWLECWCLQSRRHWWGWRHWVEHFHGIIAKGCVSLVAYGWQVIGQRNWIKIDRPSWKCKSLHSLLGQSLDFNKKTGCCELFYESSEVMDGKSASGWLTQIWNFDVNTS